MAKRSCDNCHRVGRNRFYCNHCKVVFCNNCWNEQITHRQQVDAVHEKTAIELYESLRKCLRPNRTEDEQRERHQADESTTWFGVTENETEEKILQDYGRFGELMKVLSKNRTYDIFPAIVSFVGNTGAGKSTLIKILIKLNPHPKFSPRTPVIGTLDACNRPASGDVHLYFDPRSAGQNQEQNHPIVYADSEGLEAGELEPTAVRSGLGSHPHRQQRALRKAHYGSERLINWATTAEKRSRRFTVTHVYPLILYSFSDVVVFVIKNGREFENAATYLLSWAEKAIEKSSNQPVLPHAIIAVNEAALNLPDDHWNIEEATKRLFRDHDSIIHGHPYLDRYIQHCSRRGKKIRTLEELLLMYYSSVRIVKIPEAGQPNLMEQQMRKLYIEIDKSCTKSHEKKKDFRMLFTATELNLYLQCAYDHFARTLEEPFDFIQAVFNNSPIPHDAGGNIMNLMMRIVKQMKDTTSFTEILQEMSYMIASCIMLDIARHVKQGPPEKRFPVYMTQCDNALEYFSDRGWPCEFRKNGHRCVNVRVGHATAKGHQRKDGSRIGTGVYESNFSAGRFRPQFRDQIYVIFKQSMDELKGLDRALESGVAADNHQKVLRRFFQHTGGVKYLQSNTSCFACLMERPEHPLPCGHVLCTSCVRSYGQKRDKNVVEVRSCPLESDRAFKPFHIMLKPRHCGIRILSLDGGGVRAVTELDILRALERELGGQIPIRAFFDLIVGTDMGGLLALDLATENARSPTWNRRGFTSFCLKVFERSGIDTILSYFRSVRYKTKPLENYVRERFGVDPFFGWSSHRVTPQVKVALISTSSTGTPHVIANYNRSYPHTVPYKFDRAENPKDELKNWEVARAILAVPTIFESFTNHKTHRTYHGPCVDYINPVAIAEMERKVIWPENCDSVPDVVISIGTGISKFKENEPVSLLDRLGLTIQKYRTALDSNYCAELAEKLWNEYRDSAMRNSLDKQRYVRLNVVLDEPLLDFDSGHRLSWQGDYSKAIKKSIDFESLSQKLIASCFYFELTEQTDQPSLLPNATLQFSGSFNCRLFESNIQSLGDYFRKKSRNHYPHFTIKETGAASQPSVVYIDGEVIKQMIRSAKFGIGIPEISVSQITAIVDITMQFGNGNSFPISGFPRPLCGEDVPRLRRHWGQSSSVPSEDGPEDHSREEWKGPTTPKTLPYSLSEYREASYVLGSQSRDGPNANELPTRFNDQRKRRAERDDCIPPLNHPGKFELPDHGSRSSYMPKPPRSGFPPLGTSELPESSSRSSNAAELPGRGSTRHTERSGRARTTRSEDVAELPGSYPDDRPVDRKSDPTSNRLKLNRSTTAPASQPSHQPSGSRRHSDQSTHRRTSMRPPDEDKRQK